MPINLQERIKAILDEHPDLWPAELARIAGVSKGLVTQWLNGPAKSMGYAAAQRINRKYGYAVDWLLSGEGPKLGAGRNLGDSVTVPSPEQEKLLNLFSQLAQFQRDRYIREISADVEKNQSLLAELKAPPTGERKRRVITDEGEAHRVRGGTVRHGSAAVRKRRGV